MRSTNRKTIISDVQMCKFLSLPKFNSAKKVVYLIVPVRQKRHFL